LIFSFIRYTQPGWIFNLQPKAGEASASCLYHPDLLPLTDADIVIDEQFSTLSARYADMGYRAWNKGQLTVCDKITEQKIRELPKPSLVDEYRFINKYWGKPWAMYALVRRLISFNNPFAELKAFMAGSKTQRVNPYKEPIVRGDYKTFSSALANEQPLIAVIIPTLNRYEYLADVLKDLEQQDYKNFEVIVVDQSSPFQQNFYDAFELRLQVIYQEERLLWTARNNAIKATSAEYLLFFDDDSRVEKDWITNHVKCLDYFSCDISAGVSLAKVGMKVPESYNYFRWADQFDSGNALVKRSIFKAIGLFDEQYNKQRMGDGEFGLRAYLHGYKSVSNPYAARIHLKVPAGGLREMGSWDGFRPKKWFAPKPIPSVVFLYKKYYPKRLCRAVIFLGMLLSNVPYRSKGSSKMMAVSVLLTVVKSPLLLIQYLRARSMANAMLRADDGIKLLQK
jgi:hypothetical protein